MTVHIRFFAGVLCLVKVGGHQQLLEDMAQGASEKAAWADTSYTTISRP